MKYAHECYHDALQDLPNYAQHQVPIFSLPQEWLWCETWCSMDGLAQAKTIDLVRYKLATSSCSLRSWVAIAFLLLDGNCHGIVQCNNPLTKKPKLDVARELFPGTCWH